MKHSRLIVILAITVIALTAVPVNTKASHAAAGELTYTWLSGNTYRFVYKGYFDCSGTPTQPSVYMCATNTCTNTSNYHMLGLWTGTITPANIPNCSTVPMGCTKQLTLCDSPSSNLPGYRECWYTADITLSDTCSNWEFVTTVNSRSNVDNVVAGNQYLRTTFNNTAIVNNASPYFLSKNIIYASVYIPAKLHTNLVDPDGDSLTLEVIQPFTNPNTSNLCPTTPVMVTVNPGNPPISFPNNPLPTTNTFYIDTLFVANFSPRQTGTFLVTFLVKEYRNGKLIGAVLRDMNIIILPDMRSGISAILDTGNMVGLKQFNSNISIGCTGDTIQLCYVFTSNDTNAVFYISDTNKNKMPAASVNYSAQGVDSIRACVTWLPSTADTGYFPVRFIIADSTCYPPGDAQEISAGHTIYIRSKPAIKITKYPQYIWPGLDVHFQAGNTPCDNAAYQWQVNGIEVPGATKYTWSSTTLNDQDIVRCLFKCYDTLCLDSSIIVSNALIINIATSVYNMVENPLFSLYPNPNNGNFTLMLGKNFTKEQLDTEVYDIYGQVVYRTIITDDKQQIELSGAHAGVYILRATTGNKTQIQRFTVR